MVYSTNLFTSGNTKVSTMGSNTPVAVRVRDIILDRNHPEFDKYDREDAIGVIKFTYVDSDKAFGSTEELYSQQISRYKRNSICTNCFDRRTIRLFH